MSFIIDNISFICVLMLLFILTYGCYVLIRYAERSFQRNMLITMMATWSVMIFVMLYHNTHLLEDLTTQHFNNRLIIWGMFGTLSLSLYAASIVFHKRLSLKALLIFISPAIISVLTCCVTHWYLGVEVTHSYNTWEEVAQNPWSPLLLTRYLMLVIQMIYVLVVILNIYRLVPSLNKYIEQNESEERYGLYWLYPYLAVMATIAAVYCILVICQNRFTTGLFCFLSSICFIILIECSIRYRIFPRFDKLYIHWESNKKWYYAEKGCVVELIEQTEETKEDDTEDIIEIQKVSLDLQNFTSSFDNWFLRSGIYAYPELTIQQVINRIEGCNSIMLYNIFRERGQTFQSYVREVRIREAIRLIREEKQQDLKMTDIYNTVGFSHYASFSRAFTTVVGVSPSKFII